MRWSIGTNNIHNQNFRKNNQIASVGIFIQEQNISPSEIIEKVNKLIGIQAFHLDEYDQRSHSIKCYYDEFEDVVFILAFSNFECPTFDSTIIDPELKDKLDDIERCVFISHKLLLYLLHVCHIVMIYNETHTYNITYIRTLRMLYKNLASTAGNKSTKNPFLTTISRMCSPRMLHSFNIDSIVDMLKNLESRNEIVVKEYLEEFKNNTEQCIIRINRRSTRSDEKPEGPFLFHIKEYSTGLMQNENNGKERVDTIRSVKYQFVNIPKQCQSYHVLWENISVVRKSTAYRVNIFNMQI
ncbi:hypothetical protein A3Q56_07401 [Intoshia linei]|uniref:Nonsense-mediated mRNA decay factor SMG8 n=1 Tax=Intoshia linei TaxID=1819745 RepID=A0A177AUI7_9BILA|nr:hypothetical protein A3Q56_07401 [Intoshia linei]